MPLRHWSCVHGAVHDDADQRRRRGPPVKVCVCVPVRNERRGLPGLFAALRRQRMDATIAWRLRLFLDGCTDGTPEVVRDLVAAAAFDVGVEVKAVAGPPNAGLARREAFALGWDDAGGPPDVLLSTDADSAPAPDWISTACALLGGADVVAGRITRRDARKDTRQARLEAYYDRLYAYRRRLDPLPWEAGPLHHFTGGANLAFRTEAYLAIGGFAPRPCGEDALIVDEASRAGLRVARDARLRVETSSRRIGRAPGGLADSLRAQAASPGEAPTAMVAHPADAAWQYARHAAARAAFGALGRAREAERLGALLGLSSAHVTEVAARCPNGEAFAMRIVPAAPGDRRLVGLGEAEQALDHLQGAVRDEAA